MKIIFAKPFEELKAQLVSLKGDWDDSDPTRKVLHLNGGIMNWFASTGTLQFQGKEIARNQMEAAVKALLFPKDYPIQWPKPSCTLTDAGSQVRNGAPRVKDSTDSEIVFGIVSAVGTESSRLINPLGDRIKGFDYHVEEVKVSSLLGTTTGHEYERIKELMRKGDELRRTSGNNSILAAGAANRIKQMRVSNRPKTAYIINSLKHPDEVELLRHIYGDGFFLIGIHADKKRRLEYLTQDKGLSEKQAEELTRIDEDENVAYGQKTRDTFHLSDFFMNLGRNDDQVKNTINRFLELVFSHPYKNPTFDEFAMFMAFCSSIRSGDLSRQVGAIIARDRQIIATGANECPTFGGGHYWADVDAGTGAVFDHSQGKDHKWEYDSNKAEQREIIQGISEKIGEIGGINSSQLGEVEKILNESRIKDLTEFGRVVHAEMEAILSCARAGIPTKKTTLYCTTFPCHNCAKHIIDAGIERVVYVEPYPKSKALELHPDSIELKTTLEDSTPSDKVGFEPFTGVGARRFLDLFSMSLGAGSKLRRKDAEGNTIVWNRETAGVRVPLLRKSYLDVESEAAALFTENSKPEN